MINTTAAFSRDVLMIICGLHAW